MSWNLAAQERDGASHCILRGAAQPLLVKYPACRVDCGIDVAECPIPPALCVRVVLFARDVRAGFAQILQRLMDAPRMIRTLIHGRMIGYILTVVVGGLLEVVDAGVYLAYRFNLIAGLRPIAGTVLNQPARRSKVRKGVQVGRVMSARGRRDYASAECRAEAG